jgi:DNA-binding GntR family transcriptional regulator
MRHRYHGSMDPSSPSEIAKSLQEDIRLGRLREGAILRQEALAERFGVSRQPIRLAIEALRTSGLVAVRRDRSVEVVGMSADALRNLLSVRVLVEREALVLAVPHLTERDVLAARQVQERIEVETEPRSLEDLDVAFHAALYKPCNNARLLVLIEELRREDRRPYWEQPTGSATRAKWSRQHRKILSKCAAGDAASAVAVLEEHLADLKRG